MSPIGVGGWGAEKSFPEGLGALAWPGIIGGTGICGLKSGLGCIWPWPIGGRGGGTSVPEENPGGVKSGIGAGPENWFWEGLGGAVSLSFFQKSNPITHLFFTTYFRERI
jgi:hypothetical protein